MENPVYGFNLEYRITNKSNKELVVKTRGGLNYVIRACRNVVQQLDRRVYVKLTSARIDSLHLDPAAARTPFDRVLLKQLKEALDRVENGVFCPDEFPATVETSVDLSRDLADENDVISSHIFGWSLFGTGAGNAIPALDTPDYTLQQLFDEAIESTAPRGGLKYSIYVNDPCSEHNPLYVNLMGRAHQVPIERDLGNASGVYVGIQVGENSPQLAYYTFEDLDTKTMAYIGVYASRAEASQGAGNTERLVTTEKKLAELQNEKAGLKKDYEKVSELLTAKESQLFALGDELTQTKHVHKTELFNLKLSHQQELQQLRMNGELVKVRNDMDKMATRSAMDYVKQRNSVNNWGEIAKAIGAIAGVVATGYKLCKT